MSGEGYLPGTAYVVLFQQFVCNEVDASAGFNGGVSPAINGTRTCTCSTKA